MHFSTCQLSHHESDLQMWYEGYSYSDGDMWGMAKISFLSSWIPSGTRASQACEVCVVCVSPPKSVYLALTVIRTISGSPPNGACYPLKSDSSWGWVVPRGGRQDRTLYADSPPPLPAGFWLESAGTWAPKAP